MLLSVTCGTTRYTNPLCMSRCGAGALGSGGVLVSAACFLRPSGETVPRSGATWRHVLGFNSATASPPWKTPEELRLLPAECSLQFGHGFTAVENRDNLNKKVEDRCGLQFGHGFTAVENGAVIPVRRIALLASIRPRLHRRGKLVCATGPLAKRRLLQFGHGFTAVENLES